MAETNAAAQRATKRQRRSLIESKFLGCLLGGAVGDALGAPVEFMRRDQILHRFGSDGIAGYAPVHGGPGKITDDSQMTLFTAEGLLRAEVRGHLKGITPYSGVTAHAYLRWLQTQGEKPARDMHQGDKETGWLLKHKELHSRRAPGTTCLGALRAMESFGEPAQNDSKGCGGVMRVAPVGLFALRKKWSPEETFELGAELAALTHGHATGSLTAGAFAVLVLRLAEGVALHDALEAAKEVLAQRDRHDETLKALEQAETLAGSDLPEVAAISQLGEGWVAEEALAISVYCALVASDFRSGMILAGDSDSTGSITGNLLGTMHGVTAIPKDWLAELELRQVIAEVAEDLYRFPDWDFQTDERRIWQKYPGW